MFDRQQFGSSTRRVIFFVCGYRTPIRVYRLGYWLMNRLGYRVYAYSLDSKTVASANSNNYVGQVAAVQQDIAKTISELPKKIKAFVMGNSLGSESALYALKQTPQLRAAVLVTVRGSIARFIWHTRPGKQFKKKYEKNDYDFTKISQELQSAEPTEGLELIGKRPVYIYYSKADKVIPPANTQLLIEDLQSAGVKLRIRCYRRIGHFVAAFAEIGAFWRWHRFFKKA